MNLFEQYGIKEVADVTLYAITLDKYDNEVYVPVIYFDTLKVSTVEQSAEQSTARGGLGNSELIVWDYGKEITVNLQDALYTPASQSLIWGGRFNLGKFKIFGAWNSCIFDKEKNPFVQCARPIPPDIYSEDTNIMWPADLSQRILRGIVFDQVEYYYQKINKDGPYFMKDFIIDGEKQADCAEVIIDNYENIQVEEFFRNDSSRTPFIRYTWKNAIIKLVVLDGLKVLAYSNPIDICFEENKYHNTNGELFFIKDNRKEYSIDFYLNFNQYYSVEWQQKKEVLVDRRLGTFYIVEDRNYFNFNKNNIIYPIDYGIENATKLDRMEEVIASQDFVINTEINFDMYNKSQLKKYNNSNLKFYLNPITMKPFEQNCTDFTRANGTVIKGPFALIKKGTIYYKWTRDINTDMSLGKQIIVDALHYPGNFKLVGETRSRRRDDGYDERLQFEIPLCKLSSNTSLQLAAEGEPTVYNFSLKVLRPESGIMMKLIQYKVKKDIITSIDGEKHCSNSTSIVPQEKIPTYNNCCPTSQEIEKALDLGTIALRDSGMKNINDVDLINIYNENKQAIVSVLIDAGMSNRDIDTLLPPYDVNKPLETAFFSTAAHHWLVKEWAQIPKLININIISPVENTVYTTPNDFAIPYNNTPPNLLLPTSDQEAEQWLIEINNNPEMGRNKLIVELIYDIVPSTYLTTDLAANFNINFANGSDGE